MKQPLAVFVFTKEGTATSPRYGGFAERLKRAGALPDHKVLTVALENLAYIITEDGEADIFDMVSGVSFSVADFVYLKTWEAMPEEAAALAVYLSHKGIPFADTLPVGMGVSKLATAFRLWSKSVPVPATFYVRRPDRLQALLATSAADILGEKLIIKDSVGAKGKLNFLASRSEVVSILAKHSDTQFICQRFIANDGDYRIGVYGDQARFIIKRVGPADSHLNNTSAGGQAVHIELAAMPAPMLASAEQAANACELQIAGVDIIVDSVSDRHYVLEVNQGSQVVTGAFSNENASQFADALNGMVQSRYTRRYKQPTRLIGRRSIAQLPELSAESVVAKVDTGAYSSSIHATNIRLEDRNGLQELVFEISPGPKLVTTNNAIQTIRTNTYFTKLVHSSNGHAQQRFAINTSLILGGVEVPIVLTLSDRSQMRYPLLIGRDVLRSRFLVNVELNETGKEGGKH